MNAEQFTWWLQGRAELVEAAPSEAEWKSIKAHLALVFNKVTPVMELKNYANPYLQPNPTLIVSDFGRSATC